VAEIETSTIISTVAVTISTAATQTDVIWTTVTALQRRAAATQAPSIAARQTSRTTEEVEEDKEDLSDVASVQRRQDASVVTAYVTTTIDITTTTSTFITIHTTSTELTTIYHTITKYAQLGV
jgi:hypothetical protein